MAKYFENGTEWWNMKQWRRNQNLSSPDESLSDDESGYGLLLHGMVGQQTMIVEVPGVNKELSSRRACDQVENQDTG